MRRHRLSLPATLCLRCVTDQAGCACAPADLEEKIPWTAVKKSWNTRRGDWVNSVNATLNCVALSKLLLHLEAALKTEALAPTWQRERAGWRARVEVGQLPRELEAGVRELDRNVQWARIMQADLAAGLVRHANTPLRSLAYISPTSRLCLAYISPGATSEHAAAAAARRGRGHAARLGGCGERGRRGGLG